MSSYGSHFSADTIVCKSITATVSHQSEQHESSKLDIQSTNGAVVVKKLINGTAGESDATTVLGFWGATPADQPDTVAALAVDAAAVAATPTLATATDAVCFASSAIMTTYTTAINANKDKANANAVKVNEIITHLKALGLIKAA